MSVFLAFFKKISIRAADGVPDQGFVTQGKSLAVRKNRCKTRRRGAQMQDADNEICEAFAV